MPEFDEWITKNVRGTSTQSFARAGTTLDAGFTAKEWWRLRSELQSRSGFNLLQGGRGRKAVANNFHVVSSTNIPIPSQEVTGMRHICDVRLLYAR